ncbi:2-dehydro-3-deoxyglucarate aldolase [Siculibacillus lacustris]|uniref:2-dehydro-3-deoxyglucarate aldolase n=1 Tax=Siculibacillus lacustris TaxID=1549641 RepID=A0A4Q9VWJ7_9HYPH|nr:HpcH/HpaI aldolase/citrate lyase family protein [Siculibacillus lacustris]TBW39475.1 2-dehydro-3-deoxyglucarate aldolase [Siculibacillus lacustris]
MPAPVNPFKKGLREGRRQIGLWSQIGSPTAIEMIAGSGFDFIGIDAEHGPSDLVTVYAQLQAIAAGGPSHPLVRLPSCDPVLVKQYLDIGVQTLVFPQVESAEQAAAIVASTRYPPKGVRGYCGAPRASGFGRIKDYPFTAEAEICIIVQPESMKAVDSLEAVAAIDGIDGFFFGPGDLSADMGLLHGATRPEVVEVLIAAARRIKATGKSAGTICGDEALTRRYIEAGFDIVAVGSDQGVLVRGADDLAAKFR